MPPPPAHPKRTRKPAATSEPVRTALGTAEAGRGRPRGPPAGSDLCFSTGPAMSGPRAPEPALDVQGDAPTGTGDEDTADGTQHSHRMLSFSDALLSIIATVMVRVGPAQAEPLAQSCSLGTQPRPPRQPGPPQPHPGLPEPRGHLEGVGGSPALAQVPSLLASKEQPVHSPGDAPQFLLCLRWQILPVTHTEISPQQVLWRSLHRLV